MDFYDDNDKWIHPSQYTDEQKKLSMNDYIQRLTSRALIAKKMLSKHNINLIGFTHMCFENTFIFNTENDANKAFNLFENNDNYISKFDDDDFEMPDAEICMVGWWYSKEDFLQAKKTYEDSVYDGDDVIQVIWL